MAKASALEMIEADLANELRGDGDPGHVPPLRPAAGASWRSAATETLSAFQRGEAGAKLAPLLGGQSRGVADVVKHAGLVVEAEQQRGDALAVLRYSISPDHTVGGARMLHLHHHPLALDVEKVAS